MNSASANNVGRTTRSNSIHKNGTIVRKKIDGVYYEGEISSYNHVKKSYEIKYTNGDQEVYTERDVKRYYKHLQRYSDNRFNAKGLKAHKHGHNSKHSRSSTLDQATEEKAMTTKSAKLSNNSSQGHVKLEKNKSLQDTSKTIVRTISPKGRESSVSNKYKNDFGTLLRCLFMRTNAIKGNEVLTIKNRGKSFDTLQDSIDTIKSYMGDATRSPTKTSKRSSIQIQATANSSSGPLKKRIKRRFSLDRVSSLSTTPSTFFDNTPSIPYRTMKKTDTARKMQAPLVRTPLSIICQNKLDFTPFINFTPDASCLSNTKSVATKKSQLSSSWTPLGSDCANKTTELQNCIDKNEGMKNNKKKAITETMPLFVETKRMMDTNTAFSNNCIQSPERSPNLVSSQHTARQTHPVKLFQGYHNLKRPNLAQNSFRSYSSRQATSTPTLRPERPKPIFKLPAQSPSLTKGKLARNVSSGHKSVSLDDSYMCRLRQQLEFYELKQEDVTLCKARNVSVKIGQVVLRCRHCSFIQIAYRPKGSMVIANMHRSLFQYFGSEINNHVVKLCPFVPNATKTMLKALHLQNSFEKRTLFLQEFTYWRSQADAEGVVETQDGLRFKSPQQTLYERGQSFILETKRRFANDQSTYHSFLKHLQMYKKGHLGITMLLKRVVHLFQNHPDLIREFSVFLPVADRKGAKEALDRAASALERRLFNSTLKAIHTVNNQHIGSPTGSDHQNVSSSRNDTLEGTHPTYLPPQEKLI